MAGLRHCPVEMKNVGLMGTKMTNNITVSRAHVVEIFKALNGIGELLKTLPSHAENAAVMYAIMSNLTVIRTNLTEMPRVNSN